MESGTCVMCEKFVCVCFAESFSSPCGLSPLICLVCTSEAVPVFCTVEAEMKGKECREGLNAAPLSCIQTKLGAGLSGGGRAYLT